MRIHAEGRELGQLTSTRARELFAYLLLRSDHAHRREAVADELWGDSESPDPRKLLRQALWQLQSALPTRPALLRVLDADWIRLDSHADLWLDVHELLAAWAELQIPERRTLDSEEWIRAETALRRSEGDLLEGTSWRWCLPERERLHEIYFLMADDVIAWRLARRDLAAGLHLALDIVRRDPSREASHRLLMELQARMGDRTAALRQYERCARELRRTFGVAPDRVTQRLFERLRDGAWTADAHAVLPQDPSSAVPAASVLHLLEDVRVRLSDARREVHSEIQTIEKTLKLRV